LDGIKRAGRHLTAKKVMRRMTEAAKNARNDAGRSVQEKREKYWNEVINERFPD
jgi:hypothetical protein